MTLPSGKVPNSELASLTRTAFGNVRPRARADGANQLGLGSTGDETSEGRHGIGPTVDRASGHHALADGEPEPPYKCCETDGGREAGDALF